MAKILLGIMGPGESAREEDKKEAYELGRLAAEAGFVVLTGGRRSGVMDEASRGAKEAGGLTVGILPGGDRSGMSPFVDIAVVTGMGSARNNINILSSDAVVAVGMMGSGTASEAALTLKAGKNVVLLNCTPSGEQFFRELCPSRVVTARTAREALEQVRAIIGAST